MSFGDREPKDMDDFDKMFHSYKKEVFDTLNATRGWMERFYSQRLRVFSRGLRPEVAHNWMLTFEFGNRAYLHVKSNYPKDETKIITLAIINVYLDLGAYERNFAQAWSYVNLACSLLPLVVEEKELEACAFLPTIKRKQIQEQLDQIKVLVKKAKDTNDSNEIKKILSDISEKLQPTDSSDANLDTSPTVSKDKLPPIFKKQITYAYEWNKLNRQISLKISLLGSWGFWLLFSLTVAVIVSEIILHACDPINKPIHFPFVYAALLGFFGGGLSAFIKARDIVVKITNSELIRIHTILRMILGAAGAFVVLFIVYAFNINLLEPLNEKYAFFISLCVAAGFSEQLFIGSLEKISEKLSIEPNENSEPAEKECTESDNTEKNK